MPSRNEYRNKAFDCLIQAEAIQAPGERAAILKIAQLYMKLADRIGVRHDHATAHRHRGDAHPDRDS
jgi:hypothetical protein